jgi:soluble lytic murein transglycosylase-like protein
LDSSTAHGRDFRYVDRGGRVHKIAVRPQKRARSALARTHVTATPKAETESLAAKRLAAATLHASTSSDPVAQPALQARAPSDACLLAAREAASRFRLPRELILAVVSVESSFNPNAVSVSGAMGLMQLLPGTAGDMGVLDPFDTRQNVLGGSRYLRLLLDRFGDDVTLAVAAYNVGPSVVERWGGMPALPTAQNYVAKVLRTYRLLVLAPPEWAEL